MYHVDDVPQAAGSFGDLPRKKEARRQNYVTAPPVFANALLDQKAVEQKYGCRRRLLLSREVPNVRRVGTGRRGVEDLGRFEVERYCYCRVYIHGSKNTFAILHGVCLAGIGARVHCKKRQSLVC